MLIKKPKSYELKENKVTNEKIYLDRRSLLKNMGYLGAGTLLSSSAQAGVFDLFSKDDTKTFSTKKAPSLKRGCFFFNY